MGTAFQNYFKIPFAGSRDNAGRAYLLGSDAYLWSSSPVDDNAHGLYLYPSGVNASKSDSRAHAHSVRCFKDSSENSINTQFQVNLYYQ